MSLQASFGTSFRSIIKKQSIKQSVRSISVGVRDSFFEMVKIDVSRNYLLFCSKYSVLISRRMFLFDKYLDFAYIGHVYCDQS